MNEEERNPLTIPPTLTNSEKMKKILGISVETTIAVWFIIGVTVVGSFYNSNLWYVVGILIGYYIGLIYYFNFVVPNRPFKIVMADGNYRIGDIITPGGKGGKFKVINTKKLDTGCMELTVRKVKGKTNQLQ